MPPSRRGLLRGLSYGATLAALATPLRAHSAPLTERQRQPVRPDVVAFDVVETLVSLEPLRGRLEAAGLPGDRLEVWFATLLRDAFALDATGVYKPFDEVAASALAGVFAAHGLEPDPVKIESVVAGFAELPAHPDVEPAMRTRGRHSRRHAHQRRRQDDAPAARARGRAGAGRAHHLDRGGAALEAPSGGVSPCCRRNGRRAAAARPGGSPRLGRARREPGWPHHRFVARDSQPFPAIMDAPDVRGAMLVEVAGALAALPPG